MSSGPPTFIPVTGLKCSYGKISSLLTEIIVMINWQQNSCRSIRSVIILGIKQITRLITDLIVLHSVLLPLYIIVALENTHKNKLPHGTQNCASYDTFELSIFICSSRQGIIIFKSLSKIAPIFSRTLGH